MRVPMKFLMAAALVVPAGMLVASSPVVAGAAGGTTCTGTSGVATFTPALPKVGSSATVTPIVTIKGAKVTGCSGGGVTSGTIKSKITFHDPTNCQMLLNGTKPANPPTGKITTTWNTTQVSVAKVKLLTVSGQPTQTHVVGKVVSGLFVGLHVDQTLSFAPKTGDCVNTDLSQVTFKQVTNLKIS
jgi:hypothetical protein